MNLKDNFILIICCSSSLFAYNHISATNSALETRNIGSNIIVNNAEVKINNVNNPFCIQNTSNIGFNGNKAGILCNKNIKASPTEILGNKVKINYNFTIPAISVSMPQNIIKNKDNILFNGNYKHKFLNIAKKNINNLSIDNFGSYILNIIGIFNNVNNIKLTSSASIVGYPKNKDSNLTILNIGDLNNQWDMNNEIDFLNYSGINIKNMNLKIDYKLNLLANKEIKIENMNLFSGTANLEAPTVYINNLSTLDKGKNSIEIHADKVYIKNLDLNTLSKLVFKPYSDKKIEVYIESLKLSSSSQLLLSTGKYLIKNISLPQQDSISPLIANLDKNQNTTIIIDNDLYLYANYSINFPVNKQHKVENNMKWYVNGYIYLNGYRNKINALLYAEKDIFINHPTKLNGMLSAGDKIEINANTDISYSNKIKQIKKKSFNFVKTPIQTKIAGKKYLIPVKIKNFNKIAFVKRVKGDLNTSSIKWNKFSLDDKDVKIIKFNNGVGYYPLYADKVSNNEKLLIIMPNFKNIVIREYSNKINKVDSVFNFLDINSKKTFNKINGFSSTAYNYIANKQKASHFKDFSLIDTNNIFDSDNFAIRPAKIIFKPIKAHKTIKAGSEFKLTLIALDDNNKSIKLNNYFISPNKKVAPASLRWKDTNKKALTGNLLYKKGSFKDSNNTTLSLTYDEVGKLKILFEENKGNEFAKVDAKDTPANKRLIPISSTIIKSIPYGFTVIYTNKAQDNKHHFTYIGGKNNGETNKLLLYIAAINKAGEVVKDYDKSLYATTGNLIFNVNADKPVYTNLSVNFLGKIHTQKTNFNKNQKVWHIYLSVPKDEFKKGIANLSINYNFNKDVHNPQEPFYTTLSKISFWDSDESYIKNLLETSNSVQKIKNLYGKIYFNNVDFFGPSTDLLVKYMYWEQGEWKLNKEHSSNVDGKLNLKEIGKINKSFTFKEIQSPLNGKEIVQVNLKNLKQKPSEANLYLAIPSYLWFSYDDDYISPVIKKSCVHAPCVRVNIH